MTAVSYITLSNSTGSLSKKFRVLSQGYDDGTLDKTMAVQRTIDGGLDVSQGAIYKSWSMIIKVRYSDEPETGYGTMLDLETLFSYNNPAGSPSDKITMVDHHGTSFTVLMGGQFAKQVLGCQIEGANAFFLVKLSMLRMQ